MKKLKNNKILTIFLIVLIAVICASCNKTDILKNNENEMVLGVTEEVAEKGLSSLTNETEEKSNPQKREDLKEQISNVKGLEETKKEKKMDAVSLDDSDDTESILYCTLSVRCDNIFDSISELAKEKFAILPADGVIFPETKVVFYDGESVFNVLARELKKNKIHIDFENTPMYNTVYIKGISNLYEHDCGQLSGWIYRVNGKVPGYGCSQYILKPGDKVEFVYTCDLGNDIH